MKKITQLWNLGLYCSWLLNNSIRSFFLYTPSSFPEGYTYNVYYNPKNGLDIISAKVQMGALIVFVEMITLNIIGFLIKLSVDSLYSETVLVTLFVIAFILNYFLFSKEKTYLSYFKKFEEIPKSRIKTYKIYWILFILLLIISFILSIWLFVGHL